MWNTNVELQTAHLEHKFDEADQIQHCCDCEIVENEKIQKLNFVRFQISACSLPKFKNLSAMCWL